MKKIILLFFILYPFFLKSQPRIPQWYVGVPVNDTVWSETYNSSFTCYPNPEVSRCFKLDSITGVSYCWIINDAPANSLFVDSSSNILNIGDTLGPGMCHKFYFSIQGKYGFMIKAFGVPQILGEVYSCTNPIAVINGSQCPSNIGWWYNAKCTVDDITTIRSNEKIELIIFPNPLSSSSTLHFTTQLANAELIIYDMLGKEMMRKRFSGNEMKIERGKMESGVYFVKVRAGEKEFVEKLMVE